MELKKVVQKSLGKAIMYYMANSVGLNREDELNIKILLYNMIAEHNDLQDSLMHKSETVVKTVEMLKEVYADSIDKADFESACIYEKMERKRLMYKKWYKNRRFDW